VLFYGLAFEKEPEQIGIQFEGAFDDLVFKQVSVNHETVIGG
jgi:hypothetical protein